MSTMPGSTRLAIAVGSSAALVPPPDEFGVGRTSEPLLPEPPLEAEPPWEAPEEGSSDACEDDERVASEAPTPPATAATKRPTRSAAVRARLTPGAGGWGVVGHVEPGQAPQPPFGGHAGGCCCQGGL